MKKMAKRILTVVILLAMSLAMTANAFAASAITEKTIMTRFTAAEKTWKNNSTYVATSEAGGCGTCYGFARELFYSIFNVRMPAQFGVQSPAARFTYSTNVKEIGHLDDNYSLNELKNLLANSKPGDVLIASNYGHPGAYVNGKATNHIVIIRSAKSDGSSINVFDNNWVGYNKISTNRTWTAADIRSKKPYAVTLYRCELSPYSSPAGNTTITFSSISGPGTITQGSRATIYGTISSTNSKLKTIQAVVTNSSGKSVLSASVTVNTNSYRLDYSDLDYKLTFAKLAKGNYTLTYTATTADGKKESKAVSFKVNAAKTSINFSSMSGPGTIKQGSKATIYGTVSSTNSNLKTIKAVVTNSSGKSVMSGSVSVNTNSYKLAYSDLDYKLTFAILPKGNYTLTYTATTADGTSNTYSTSFKVN